MILLYNSLLILFFPVLLLVFSFSRRGRLRIRERLGTWRLSKERYIWFHAASLGEVRALKPLLLRLRKEFPEKHILISTTSSSGAAEAERLGVSARLLPFDLPFFYERAWRDSRPEILLVTETEIWPNMLRYCKEQAVPALQINAVISSATFPFYSLVSGFVSDLYHSAVKRVFVAENQSLERLKKLGLSAESLVLNGNTKFESVPSLGSLEARQSLRQEVFANAEWVISLVSLHPAELAVLSESLNLLADFPEIRILLAPRHEEKFSFFRDYLDKQGVPYASRSKGDDARDKPVFLLDTLGEAERFLGTSDICVLGGTFFSLGGHNPLEAAAYGLPIVLGPYCSKIYELSEELRGAGASLHPDSASDLRGVLAELLEDKSRVKDMGAAARSVWSSKQGASEQITKFVAETLGAGEEIERVAL